jgi:hypothetical protein
MVPEITETWELPEERLMSVPVPEAPPKAPVPPTMV